MLMFLARLVVATAEGYALTGIVFAAVFLPRGILRVDDRLHGSPWTVRLVLAPGIAAFWPLFAWRWMAGRTAPEERNAHRLAAERAS